MIAIDKLRRIFEDIPQLRENDAPIHVPISAMPRVTWRELAELIDMVERNGLDKPIWPPAGGGGYTVDDDGFMFKDKT
jgi:hypothetical protein